MGPIRSWFDTVFGVVAGEAEPVDHRIDKPEGSVAHIEVIVYPPLAGSADHTPAQTTLASIERARDVLGDSTSGLDGRAPEQVPVHVSVSEAGLDVLPVDREVLWLFLLDGAEIESSAFVSLIDLFDRRPDLDMAYTDAANRADGPSFLPGFSPDRLADQHYVGHLVAFRPHRLVSTGATTQPGTVTATSIDGPWSLSAVARTVAHLPVPLYSPAPSVGVWDARSTGRTALAEGLGPPLPLVSVVIPTNGSARDLDRGPTTLVDQAVRSVLNSRYPRLEIVVVETPGSPEDLTSRLTDLVDNHHSGGRTLTAVRDARPFNFSNACNRGAVRSTGTVLVFLNDDTEVIAADWLVHLVRHARKPEIGPVGARLLYEDGTVQHSGIWSRGGHPTHRYEGWPGDADGYLGALRVTQNCLAVTGACLAVERSKFELVGGFSPVFPNSFNDVDLCLKLWDRGYRTVIEPRAELYHFEASTRNPSITDDDLTALHDRWRWRLNHDPFDNPNHTADRSEEWPLPAASDADSDTVSAGSGSEPDVRFWPLDSVGRFSES